MKKHAGIAMAVVSLLVVLSGIGFFATVRSGQPEATSPAGLPNATAPMQSNTAASRPRSLPETQPGKAGSTSGPKKTATKVIVYYFHRTLRCPSCIAIEEYTREAVQRTFANALESAKLEWVAVNIEIKGNEHFEDDFRLQHQSVVLVEVADGRTTRWKNLAKVWDLLDDKETFQEYVAREVSAYLGR